MLCPIVVGRDDELALLRDHLERAIAGRGGVVALVGDAGMGKSRLGRELIAEAHARGVVTLTGRAAAGHSAVPYRPLTEAIVGALREADTPRSPRLAGFEGHLGRLVPAWRSTTEGGADESPVLLGEAVVRLFDVMAGRQGALVLLEDLHWADAETLAVVEYLADALADVSVLCVVTSRPDGAVDTSTHLRRHPHAVVVGLTALGPTDVARVVTASLGPAAAPREVVDFVAAHCDGNPFLAEELLAGLVAAGSLVFDDGWRTTAPLTPSVPTDVARSIRARMGALEPVVRRVLGAAALLGRGFDWNLLPRVAEVDGRAVVEALRQGVDAQLIEVDGHEFRFRHGLTREAVLGDLLPPERQELARRAWPAVEQAHPGLPGVWCERAAELAEAAGDAVAGAERLVESARRALDAGALTTALATIGRARVLAAGSHVELDAEECFVQIASHAGRPADALAAGRPLAHRFDVEGAATRRRVDLLVVLARAGVAAGDGEVASGFIERARGLAASDDDATIAGVEAVAAHVALGADELERAEELARSAVDRATRAARPAVACEALEALGRVARTRSSGEAIAAFEDAAELAEAHGLTGWQLRARHEIALERWADGDTSGLRQTRDLAAAHGAMVTVAVMDLSLADIALAGFDRERCLHHAEECVAASRRFGLATLSVAELWLAGAHALAGDGAAMEAASIRALERDPHDPRILGDLWGRVRATLSMVRDDRAQLRVDLDRMMEHVDRAPVTTSIFPNRLTWVMMCSIDDDDLGLAAQRRLRALTHLEWWPTLWSVLDLAGAVTLGRQGRGDEASEQARAALDGSRRSITAPGSSHYIHLLLGEAQVRDGWGDPASLLRPAEAFFAERGYDAIARRCRIVLGRAGEKMPRRGRGDAVVPERLRAVGITSRELDVLQLIAEGCSNREIASRLDLSVKTVERHVSSLFDRTGIRNRTDLATWVARPAN